MFVAVGRGQGEGAVVAVQAEAHAALGDGVAVDLELDVGGIDVDERRAAGDDRRGDAEGVEIVAVTDGPVMVKRLPSTERG